MASGSLDRFLASAERLGVPVDRREFPAGTRTAADAAAAIGCDVRQIVKSLVFIADDTPVLALTSGGNRVDEAKLARTIRAARSLVHSFHLERYHLRIDLAAVDGKGRIRLRSGVEHLLG